MFVKFKIKPGNENMVDCDGMINTGLKRTAHNCDISPIVESTTDCVITFAKDKKLDVGKYIVNELKEYISSCARLAWGMVVQTPPLTLEYGNKPKYMPNQHELSGIQRESITSSTVLTYIWPVLREQDGGRVMCKGILTPERAITKRGTSFWK
ncbi:uncharacterized protein LOC102807734 [Saccoglossus kowalevskii]|uniref:Mitochondria-eating protein n=1 Tax=Saccoglossus kowalevskii TaxID=10224 RepID=A0ABM0MDG6_SACKO|nr:PREDICTED: uncharacterized protein LOC102807734 [Saccoglossus kowalevskii]